ncbi:MAG: AraC family transcriptional regulator [Lachnospiraceae bacterium]|nr:AraC family transcriptional regulator [Lachnospiraceae bacterium]
MRILAVGDRRMEAAFKKAGEKYGHCVLFSEMEPAEEEVCRFEPEAAVLMAGNPASAVQDYLVKLYEASPVRQVLVFERQEDGSFFYAKTWSKENELESFFCEAAGEAQVRKLVFPEESWNLRFPDAFKNQRRREITKTMLYGVTGEEFLESREKYELDINGDNFYLFMWELNKSALVDYSVNKSVHYFLHALRLEDFMEVLKENMGGEIVFSDISFAYIIVNAAEPVSLRMRKMEAEHLSGQLARVAGTVSSQCFISRLLHGPEEIYSGHQEFKKTCAYRFFCREAVALSEEYIKNHRKWFSREEIETRLENIQHYLSFDIGNEELRELIRHMYLRIVKPSMSYALYYMVSESILESLQKELSVKLLMESIDSPWLILTSQMGTIEESCGRVLECISMLASQQVKTHNIGNLVVRQALQHVEENYAKMLSVSEIARDLNVSPSYLNQCFKKETGTSLKRYLTMYRMTQAKKLLLNTDASVSAVAIAVGYDDYRQFSKMFKAFTGVTPVQCRKGVI